MFGFFAPRCPLDAREKTWVELRMQWLIDRIGFEKLRTVEVLTPSPRHFPDPHHGSDEEVERLFDRVCVLIGVPRAEVELMLFEGTEPPPHLRDSRQSALGLFQKRSEENQRHTVWIERSNAANPMQLVAVVAHELAHCVLLGNDLLTSEEADHEFITDLLPVVRGLGIFLANSTVTDQAHGGPLVSWWSISRSGYLPSRMFGYALAVFAWLRDERHPEWARYLRGDARTILKTGLKYLYKTNDCRCRPPGTRDGPDSAGLLQRLRSATPGIYLSALWELRRPGRPEVTGEEWAALAAGLDRRDPLLVCETALTIAAQHRPDSAVCSKCCHLLQTYFENSAVRAALALVLGTQNDRMDVVIDELSRLLESESQRVVIAALTSLRIIGPMAGSIALAPLLAVFRKGLLACDEVLLMHVADALRAVCETPEQRAAMYFEHDAELKMHAHEALRTEIDNGALLTARLPTAASLPVPLPDWRPMPLRLDPDPEPVRQEQEPAS